MKHRVGFNANSRLQAEACSRVRLHFCGSQLVSSTGTTTCTVSFTSLNLSETFSFVKASVLSAVPTSRESYRTSITVCSSVPFYFPWLSGFYEILNQRSLTKVKVQNTNLIVIGHSGLLKDEITLSCP
jgi:hypothetical protein